MSDFPETRESLLLQVRDPQDVEAWQQFTGIYRPVIYRLARQRGMQDADAQDLAQQVMIAVASAIGTWDRRDETVRFRHWLRRVARNAILNALTRKPVDQAGGGAAAKISLDHCVAAQQDSVRSLELEYRRELYVRAAEVVAGEVQPDTWRAFQRSVIEGCSVAAVADELGKSIGVVYAARSRVMRRLRETVVQLEEAGP